MEHFPVNASMFYNPDVSFSSIGYYPMNSGELCILLFKSKVGEAYIACT